MHRGIRERLSTQDVQATSSEDVDSFSFDKNIAEIQANRTIDFVDHTNHSEFDEWEVREFNRIQEFATLVTGEFTELLVFHLKSLHKTNPALGERIAQFMVEGEHCVPLVEVVQATQSEQFFKLWGLTEEKQVDLSDLRRPTFYVNFQLPRALAKFWNDEVVEVDGGSGKELGLMKWHALSHVMTRAVHNVLNNGFYDFQRLNLAGVHNEDHYYYVFAVV